MADERLAAEPSLKSAIDAAMEMGWEFFDTPDRQGEAETSRLREAANRTAELAAGLYAISDEFRTVLEWMLDVSLRRASFIARLGLPMDQAYGYGCFREGQNAMTAALLKLIAEGSRRKPPQPREKN
jgi:hypothetical protein